MCCAALIGAHPIHGNRTDASTHRRAGDVEVTAPWASSFVNLHKKMLRTHNVSWLALFSWNNAMTVLLLNHRDHYAYICQHLLLGLAALGVEGK